MHQYRLRGKTVSVGEAKFRRQMQEGDRRVLVDQSRGVERRLERFTKQDEVVQQPVEGGMQAGDQARIHQGNGCMKRLALPVLEANMEWLARSLVGYTLNPLDLRSLKRVIQTNVPHVEDVREIERTKVLVTFDTVEHSAEAYTFKLDSMLQVFYRIRRWEEAECGGSRQVWLECYGMPIHVWSEEAFKAVGGLWGNVIHCAIPTGAGASFRVGRVQVDTCVFDEIRESVRLVIGEKEVTVFVQEMGWVTGGPKNSVEVKQAYEGVVDVGNGEHSWRKAEVPRDLAADMITGNENGGEHEKGRIVNSEVLLNDMNVDFLNFKKIVEVTDSEGSTNNNGKGDMLRFGESEEGDSDRTVTQVFSSGEGRVVGSSVPRADLLQKDEPIRPNIGRILGGRDLGHETKSPMLTN
ncbi:hypothetical protein S83_015760 [Arachis hypogaea]